MQTPCQDTGRLLEAARPLLAFVVVYVAVSLFSVAAMVGFWGLVRLLEGF